MQRQRAITRTASALVVIVVIIIAGVSVYLYAVSGTPSTSTTTTPMSTTSTVPVTVQFYETFASSEAAFVTNTLIPEFEQANPGITVQLVNEPSPQDVATSVQALVKGNNVGTTLVGLDNLEVGVLVYGNSLMNLTSIISTLEPTGLISSATNMINYEKTVYNAIYFLPFRSNIPLTWYSKTAFANAGITSPPANTAQLLTDAATLKSKGYSTPVMFQGSNTGASNPTEVYQWIVQFGGNPFLLNDSGSIAAFQYLQELSAYFHPAYTTATYATYTGLATGDYQLLDYQWPYVYGLLTNSTLGMTDQTLGVYPGPAGPANGNHLLGGDVLVVPKGATNLPAVEKFANFLLSAQPQQQMLLQESWVAVNSQAYNNLPGNFTAVGTALQEAISQGVFLRNPTPWITQWANIAYDAFTKIVVDHASPTSIQGILNQENQQMYNYLVSNYGQSTATQYEQNQFKPISVS